MKPGRQSNESRLLSKDENAALFSLLGMKCESLATSVVQLFLTESPNHDQWNRKDAGIMCVVKDHIKRSYFFRLYCLTRKALIWENELYNTLEYMSPRIWLHTFEAESCMAAFNFADEEEAKLFQKVVLDTLHNKRQKRIERRSRTAQQLQANQGSSNTTGGMGISYYQKQNNQGSLQNLTGRVGSTYNQNGPHANKGHDTRSDTCRMKKKFTKADIGLPQDFRHVSHVGWDANRGFNRHGEALDPQLKEFFTKAGVSDNQLRDPETREFIYEFIEAHGGLKSVKSDVSSHIEPFEPAVAPPVPSRAPPLHSVKPSPPVPPNVHNSQARYPPPSVNQRTAPPPPPPPPTIHSTQKPPADPEISRNIPPPPPPPPPLPPALSEMVGSSVSPRLTSGNSDARSALMEEIKSGTSLKHVDVEKHVDSRGELLIQIRQGVELKSVQHIEKPSGPSVPLDGLAGALARALAERSKAFHNDSETESESEAEGDSDSEWEE